MTECDGAIREAAALRAGVETELAYAERRVTELKGTNHWLSYRNEADRLRALLAEVPDV